MEGLDPGITMESVNWLLSENVKAGTLALYWCMKTQVNKVQAKAFYRWQQRIMLRKFLSPYRHSVSIGEKHRQHTSNHGDHTEHMVTDTIHRSEQKLMCKKPNYLLVVVVGNALIIVSLRRDYLRHEKGMRQAFNSGSASKGSRPTSSSAPTSPAKELPSYMRGTTSVTQKYSMSGVTEHQVVRNITRAASPAKEAMTAFRRGSGGHRETQSSHQEAAAVTPRRSGANRSSEVERTSELQPQRLR